MTSTSKSRQSNLPPREAPCRSVDSLQELRSQLRQWMQQCRTATLALFDGIDYDTFCQQAHPDFSPIGWHLGHIAYTEALWLLEHSAGSPPQLPHYRRLFAADSLPKAERVYLPTLTETCDYLATIRQQVFDYLDAAPLEQEERLWRWLLQHESQHCETIALVLELLKQRDKEQLPIQQPSLPPHSVRLSAHGEASLLTPEMICIPAGPFDCGNDSIDALDNERPVHRVYLETYWIDRYPVTCGQFQAFIAAGGYNDARWWSPEGWAWRQAAAVVEPLYWSTNLTRSKHPVCGVSWYEADAYARFAGKRLPTELEWEKAASWNSATQQRQSYPWGEASPSPTLCNHSHQVGQTTPIDRYPAGDSPYGCSDMLGNVWEWTSSWFDGYAGFTAYPYRGYSQAYFDGQHRVLRGGSWATRLWAMRCAFRNWYHPHVREVLAGFRCAADSQ